MVEFLADRDLGKQVPAALREQGYLLHTLPEIFGSETAAQKIQDVQWIKVAGENGWAALTKNSRIRYVRTEREALRRHRVALFALSNGSLSFAQMAEALLMAMPRIIRICEAEPGGCIWIVHRDGRVEPSWPTRRAGTARPGRRPRP